MARKNKTSTERCAEIYKYIRDFLMKKGFPPSVREIGTAVGLSSSSTVHSYLHMLEDEGKIHRDPTKPRAIELVGEKPWEHMLRVPLVGAVAAGVPITAEENVEEVFNVPSALLGTQDDTFMLRVKGESMINAGILDGDIIIAERTPEARNGDKVVALIEDEATVKTFYKENDEFRLQPENDYMEPIICDEVAILGRVVASMRYYN